MTVNSPTRRAREGAASPAIPNNPDFCICTRYVAGYLLFRGRARRAPRFISGSLVSAPADDFEISSYRVFNARTNRTEVRRRNMLQPVGQLRRNRDSADCGFHDIKDITDIGNVNDIFKFIPSRCGKMAYMPPKQLLTEKFLMRLPASLDRTVSDYLRSQGQEKVQPLMRTIVAAIFGSGLAIATERMEVIKSWRDEQPTQVPAAPVPPPGPAEAKDDAEKAAIASTARTRKRTRRRAGGGIQ